MVTKSHNPPRKRPLPPLVLWLGVLIADRCLMAPVLLVCAMMASGWVGGSSHPENFWRIVIPSLAVLSVLSVLVLFVWRHFRWLYWIGLGGVSIVSWLNCKPVPLDSVLLVAFAVGGGGGVGAFPEEVREVPG